MSDGVAKKEDVVYGLGKWQRVDENENWCDICNKSTLWWAPTYIISIKGVTSWGKVVGCKNGKNWRWTNPHGKVTRQEDHRQVGDQ